MCIFHSDFLIMDEYHEDRGMFLILVSAFVKENRVCGGMKPL